MQFQTKTSNVLIYAGIMPTNSQYILSPWNFVMFCFSYPQQAFYDKRNWYA